MNFYENESEILPALGLAISQKTEERNAFANLTAQQRRAAGLPETSSKDGRYVNNLDKKKR